MLAGSGFAGDIVGDPLTDAAGSVVISGTAATFTLAISDNVPVDAPVLAYGDGVVLDRTAETGDSFTFATAGTAFAIVWINPAIDDPDYDPLGGLELANMTQAAPVVFLINLAGNHLQLGRMRLAPVVFGAGNHLLNDQNGLAPATGTALVNVTALRTSQSYNFGANEFQWRSRDGVMTATNQSPIESGKLVQDGDTTGTFIQRVSNVEPFPSNIFMTDVPVV